MNFVEKIGDIKVYTERNTWNDNDCTVYFYNGCNCMLREVYITDDVQDAIEDLFRKIDIFTAEWLYIYVTDLEKPAENTYRSGADYFSWMDDTKYFRHFLEPAKGWGEEKTEKGSLIDRRNFI